MERAISVTVTDRGILILDEALDGLNRDELEAIRKEDQIVIRPKPQPIDERARVTQVLRDAGLLYEPDWEQPAPVSEPERARLARKLASSPPLSEVIIADREDRV
jgi:virulence-associated protein VagC